MIRVLLFALLFAMPAMADNFSNNQSGVSSCTIDIVGSSSTPITATANYSPITYNCSAGTYLPADAIECATCLAGYYCPGGDYAFNELNASGLNACPGARPSSNPGNSSQNNCYTPCASDKIDAGLDGTNCQTPKFTVTTTNLSANTEFRFYISATGTFYVDCGAGGTLSGTGVSNNTITRNDTTEALYTCTYSTAGTKTIRMAGLATGYMVTTAYNVDKVNNIAAIRFYGAGASQLISSISGSLGTIFPTLGSADTQQPRFVETFRGASFTTIPENLFSGIHVGATWMFYATFDDCRQLTAIPANLFANITEAKEVLFLYTFMNCSSITQIPENLFAHLSGVANWLFEGAFMGCSSLQSIPENLFDSISGTPAVGMFQHTFGGCTNVTSIPANLFAHITGTARQLFAYTFRGTHITTIPSNLFRGITGGDSAAVRMFLGTFSGCSSLTSIPDDLFSGITDVAQQMFEDTFRGCSSLTSYIPPSTFAGLIANNSPTATNMWANTFAETQVLTSCPSGMTQYITGYEDYWSGKVSCVDANLTCSAGNYLPAHGYECAQCTANNYCVGGTYPYSATESHGITPCDTGYSSAAGASSCTPNTINIQWDDGNGGYTAGTCSYGGSITTPTTAPTKRGHVFTGWTFDLDSGS